MFKLLLKILPLIIHEGFDLLFEIREERKNKKEQKLKTKSNE